MLCTWNSQSYLAGYIKAENFEGRSDLTELWHNIQRKHSYERENVRTMD